jgi:hypothetical protein
MGGRRVRLTASPPSVTGYSRKIWEPRRLKILWAFTACYRDNFNFKQRVLTATSRHSVPAMWAQSRIRSFITRFRSEHVYVTTSSVINMPYTLYLKTVLHTNDCSIINLTKWTKFSEITKAIRNYLGERKLVHFRNGLHINMKHWLWHKSREWRSY